MATDNDFEAQIERRQIQFAAELHAKRQIVYCGSYRQLFHKPYA